MKSYICDRCGRPLDIYHYRLRAFRVPPDSPDGSLRRLSPPADLCGGCFDLYRAAFTRWIDRGPGTPPHCFNPETA